MAETRAIDILIRVRDQATASLSALEQRLALFGQRAGQAQQALRLGPGVPAGISTLHASTQATQQLTQVTTQSSTALQRQVTALTAQAREASRAATATREHIQAQQYQTQAQVTPIQQQALALATQAREATQAARALRAQAQAAQQSGQPALARQIQAQAQAFGRQAQEATAAAQALRSQTQAARLSTQALVTPLRQQALAFSQTAREARNATQALEEQGVTAGTVASRITALGSTLRTALAGAGIVVGLRTITQSLTNVIQTGTRFQALRASFAVVSGGAREGAEALQFVRQTANRLGFDLLDLTGQYLRLQAASAGTTLAGQQTRDLFTATTTAARVLGLTSDQLGGTLLALQQVISKGTLQSEELRRQLGERLPGAFQIAARAMGVTTQELGKMLEQGQVLATDFIPRFARQLQLEFGGGAEAASRTAVAAFARFRNALAELADELAQNGILDFLQRLAETATAVTKALGQSGSAMREFAQTRAEMEQLALQTLPGGGGRTFQVQLATPDLLRQLEEVEGRLQTFRSRLRQAQEDGREQEIQRLEAEIQRFEGFGEQLRARFEAIRATIRETPAEQFGGTEGLTEHIAAFRTELETLLTTQERTRQSAQQLADVTRGRTMTEEEQLELVKKQNAELLKFLEGKQSELRLLHDDPLITQLRARLATETSLEAQLKTRRELETQLRQATRRSAQEQERLQAAELRRRETLQAELLGLTQGRDAQEAFTLARERMTEAERQAANATLATTEQLQVQVRAATQLDTEIQALTKRLQEWTKAQAQQEEALLTSGRGTLEQLQDDIDRALGRVDAIQAREFARQLAQADPSQQAAIQRLQERLKAAQPEGEAIEEARRIMQLLAFRPRYETRRDELEAGLARLRELQRPPAELREAEQLARATQQAEILQDVMTGLRDTAQSLGDSLEEGLVAVLTDAAAAGESLDETLQNLGKGLIKLFGQEIIRLGLIPLRQALDDFAKQVGQSEFIKKLVALGVRLLGATVSTTANSGGTTDDLGFGYRQHGGPLPQRGLALVGEAGPEVIDLRRQFVFPNYHPVTQAVLAKHMPASAPPIPAFQHGGRLPSYTTVDQAVFTQPGAPSAPGPLPIASTDSSRLRLLEEMVRSLEKRPIALTVELRNPIDPRTLGMQPEEVVRVVGRNIQDDGILRRLVIQHGRR